MARWIQRVGPNPGMSPASRRPALVAIAGVNVAIGVVTVVALADQAGAVDVRRNLEAARDLVAGQSGADPGYLYSPFAALVTVPLTWLPEWLAIGAWLAIGVVIIVGLVARATPRLPVGDRALVAVAALFFVPVAYDLLLGNVTTLAIAAVALVAWRADRGTNGIVLGLLLAAAPKPGLIPILLWMLLFRRRALAGSLAAGGLATLATVLLVGMGPYVAWIEILREPEYLSSPMAGNLTLLTLPAPWGTVLAIAAVGLAVLAARRGPWPGLLAAICVGLLVAPYTIAYAAGLLLVAVPPLAAASPALATVAALTGSLGVILAFQAWVGSLLVVAAALPASWWPADSRSSSRLEPPTGVRSAAVSVPGRTGTPDVP